MSRTESPPLLGTPPSKSGVFRSDVSSFLPEERTTLVPKLATYEGTFYETTWEDVIVTRIGTPNETGYLVEI